MALDQETINAQLTLLAAHRSTLAHLVQQAAQFGGEVFAPPQTANGIAGARAEVQRIKAVLRERGVLVEDEPNDEAPPLVEPVHIPQTASDVVVGDKVVGDKILGGKRAVDTGGGDYAEDNIDKRQGTFVEGTIYRDVIGQQVVQQAASHSPALHQLGAPLADFIGREQEIGQLVTALSKAGGAAAAISGVRGLGGIGKSELAYIVAHQLRDSFPDAQILVELRGASSSLLTPELALQFIIHSFTPETTLPDDLSQLQGLYRSILSGKRVLILADDAKDAVQIRRLLPPSGCALLVTSRNHFSLPGMMALDLGTLPPNKAEILLLEIAPRIGRSAGELAQLCGYLPLALRVSGGLLATNDAKDVTHYLEQLRAERLKHLRDPDNPDDPAASVEASLRLSYDALEPTAQRALCQMSVFPTNFDLEAAKAIVVVERDVEEVLDLLRRRSIVEWDALDRHYYLHDLVQAFAFARLENVDMVRLRHERYYS
jgi:NB-ARC domain